MDSRDSLEPLQQTPSPLSDPPLPGSIRSPSARLDKLLRKVNKKEVFEKDALTGLHGQRYLCRNGSYFVVAIILNLRRFCLPIVASTQG